MIAFTQNSRLTGTVTAVIEDSRLGIQVQKPLHKAVQFNVDVACLAPGCTLAKAEGRWGFGLAALAAAVLSLLLISGLLREGLFSSIAWQLVAVISLLGATALALAFRIRLFGQVVLRTRYAGLPLLVTPVLADKRAEMEAFLSLLRLRVGEAETKRSLTAERLRSGEIKTLRRLADERVIPVKSYEEAKAAILSR